jgi:hypothetical protein
MFKNFSRSTGMCLLLVAVCTSSGAFAAGATTEKPKNPVSATLVCVETASSTGSVGAHSSIAIDAPACDAGYTIVSGGCGSSNPPAMYISEIDTNQYGFGCEFVSNSDNTESVAAYGHCCRVDVKIKLP